MKISYWLNGYAILTILMVIAPAISVPAAEPRVEDRIFHVTNFSDGKAERIISFSAQGTDKSSSIAIPNGARVVSATMNITGLPTSDGGTDYPENITVDAGNDGSLEYAFQGKGYGRMGYQTLFSNGATYSNVSLPFNGGTNATPSVRLPKNATATSTKMDIANLRGGGGNLKVGIETAPASKARDTANNDPVYSIQSICTAQGWTASSLLIRGIASSRGRFWLSCRGPNADSRALSRQTVASQRPEVDYGLSGLYRGE